MHDYGKCICAYSKKEGQVYKGDSSSPRQGCQLTKAAQHASVCLGEGGLWSCQTLQVCLEGQYFTTSPSPGSEQRHLKHAHIQRRLVYTAWGLTRASRCLTTNLLQRGNSYTTKWCLSLCQKKSPKKHKQCVRACSASKQNQNKEPTRCHAMFLVSKHHAKLIQKGKKGFELGPRNNMQFNWSAYSGAWWYLSTRHRAQIRGIKVSGCWDPADSYRRMSGVGRLWQWWNDNNSQMQHHWLQLTS